MALHNSYVFLFIYLFQACLAYYTLYDFNAYQAQMIVDEHNRLRAQEPASDMQEMVWNSELALIAKDWASRCTASHRSDRVNKAGFNIIGENIWWSSESYLRNDLASIVRSLYDEKPFYSYSNGWCQPGQMCGHYTQVVWANSCAVGCAAAYCDYIYNGRGITRGHFVVCNYGPAGNYFNQRPYSYGYQCASCPGSCRNGLCASTCASDWWRNQQWRQPAPAAPVAVQPQSPPVPQATSPPLPQNIPFQPAPVVPVQPPVVPQKPKKPVNLFQTIVPLAKEKPELIRTEIISTDCVDRNPFCTYWGQTGECQKNPHYMNLYCKLTCDPVCSASVVPVPQPQAKPSSITGNNDKCVDLDSLCGFWASTGECASNSLWMNDNCYASCFPNNCKWSTRNTITDCRDDHLYCSFWASTAECNKNTFYMQWKCRRSCGFC